MANTTPPPKTTVTPVSAPTGGSTPPPAKSANVTTVNGGGSGKGKWLWLLLVLIVGAAAAAGTYYYMHQQEQKKTDQVTAQIAGLEAQLARAKKQTSSSSSPNKTATAAAAKAKEYAQSVFDALYASHPTATSAADFISKNPDDFTATFKQNATTSSLGICTNNFSILSGLGAGTANLSGDVATVPLTFLVNGVDQTSSWDTKPQVTMQYVNGDWLVNSWTCISNP